MSELEIKAGLFAHMIDLSIEYPKMSRKLSKYCKDMQVRAFKAGYEQCNKDFFNDLMAKMEIKP